MLLGCPNFIGGGGGSPLIWAMPKFKHFFLRVCSLREVLKKFKKLAFEGGKLMHFLL